MLVEERRCQINTCVETAHPARIQDTIADIIASADAVRHVLQSALHADAMARRNRGAQDFVLPVGVGISEQVAAHAERLDKVSVFIATEHIVFLQCSRNGNVAVVRECRLLSVASLLCSDDDDTVAGTRTIDSRCRSTLQYGETLDIIRVDVGKDITHTRSRIVVDNESVDNIQRVVACRERSTATDTDLCAGTRSTASGLHIDTSHFTNEHIGCVVGDTLRQVVRLHCRNRTGEISLFCAAVTDNYNLVQFVVSLFLQDDVDVLSCFGRSCFVADVGDFDYRLGVSLNREVTVEIRYRSAVGAFNSHRSSDNRFASRVLHVSLYDDLLSEGTCRKEQPASQGSSPQGITEFNLLHH